MVVTKEELIGSLQNEVRILLHLASKIDPEKLGYRPSPKQRSMLELLQYLTVMGPALIQQIKIGTFDLVAFRTAEAEAANLSVDAALAKIRSHSIDYANLLSSLTEAELRGEVEMFGRRATRGAMIVNMVLCGCAAYRMQLFLYLKAVGREELGTMDLWAGMDSPKQATA